MKAILTKNGNSFSKHQRIITGGPKSSILGPLFFNILLTLIWGWGGGGGGGGAGRENGTSKTVKAVTLAFCIL